MASSNLQSLLGGTPDAVRAYLCERGASDIEEKTYSDCSYIQSKSQGISMRLKGDQVDCVYVYSSSPKNKGYSRFQGDLPLDLTLDFRYADVAEALGVPADREGGKGNMECVAVYELIGVEVGFDFRFWEECNDKTNPEVLYYCFFNKLEETDRMCEVCGKVCSSCCSRCKKIDGCKTAKYGSYCKAWQSPAVCFGLVEKADGSYCFQPNDKDCYGDAVSCDSSVTTATTTTSTRSTTTTTSTTITTTTTTKKATTTTAPFGGVFCGNVMGESFKVDFESGHATISVMGMAMHADYKVNGNQMDFYNYDATLTKLMHMMNIDSVDATIVDSNDVHIKIGFLIDTTVTRC
ncbi:hypothetical protein FOL47_004069 [Perkinsus chesapeaki]|uniref:Uncharacterized protein n=1 Tax=Perkinsus chesapeaki TaxID=330153 RepID=A0A7J6M4G0_PERCH|nr:hypothetical protein FOL47_004069 [Perkinsus chesapeaki]